MAGGLVIRAPNHLGDLVMALPALGAEPAAAVLVARWLVPVIRMVGGADRRIIPFDRGVRGVGAAAAEVRAGRYRSAVLLTPSFSSALIFALAGVARRRGTASDHRSVLLTDRVPAAAFAGSHRAGAYVALVTGELPGEPPTPRLEVPAEARDRWRRLVGPAAGPLVGLFPGSNAPARRWETDRFAEVARRLAANGMRIVVFGGAAERELAARVAGDVGIDVAGRTDLPLLAAGLAACRALITNDSGPMHLAAAVGTPTISLQGASDPRETRPLGAGHVYLQRADLPCVPCVRNHCPRRGRGYILPEAERECLRLIEVGDVVAAAGRVVMGAKSEP